MKLHVCIFVALLFGLFLPDAAPADPPNADVAMRALLDAPLLFTKRHSYSGIHIYDTYYKWPPGGGGIYILKNPAEPRDQWRIRPVIDPDTPETLGFGVYDDPELSWDATKILFTFKGEPHGSTSIYEIGIDGKGLRLVSNPECTLDCYQGRNGGQHDVYPAYLPDDRIVFLSTRPSGLVPCNNTGVAILHVMNPDGSDMHPISVNNVNEFDPTVMPDGRILFGRWEYVDKNALTIQSLWSVNPDGTQETAFYANNMVFPEAILDARPVPDTHLIVGTFSKHNSTPRGSIALVDPRMGKNDPKAIKNLEHPDNPTCDTGDSCEPWPVTSEVFLYSGRAQGDQRSSIRMIDREGRQITLLSDPEICLHSPMLIKPRRRPNVIADVVDRSTPTGRFFLQDIYQGLVGVKRGEVKHLRVIEETSRVSASTMGGSPYNQTFLVSAALAFGAKNYLGIVPVAEDGSAYFEVPAGRAVYLQALDTEGRLVQSMRTFVQASPGTTRSCIGCHEHKYSTSATISNFAALVDREPDRLQPESWGSGYVDYPSRVQPILDRHCVRCHGGPEGIAAGMDLSGGWTEHFNISYENLANRRETQLIAYWIAGIDCMNGTAPWSAQIFAPRQHGSGAAPLANLLVNGHDGYISDMTRPERDMLMAWMDSNGLYHGTWNATNSGCAIKDWKSTQAQLVAEMQKAGCFECHAEKGKLAFIENDWINLQNPQWSRILRAPLSSEGEGYGLSTCRDRKIDPRRQRIHLLWRGYAHAVQPPEAFPKHEVLPPDPSGEPAISFASTEDEHYQRMLSIIRGARDVALANPRVDMPGAEVIAGMCRTFMAPPVPAFAPRPIVKPDRDGVVQVSWEVSAATIGLEAELHRATQPRFSPNDETRLVRTALGHYEDVDAPQGELHYALVLCSSYKNSLPTYADASVPAPLPPSPPTNLAVLSAMASVRLQWTAPELAVSGYHVYRAPAESTNFQRITQTPVRLPTFIDGRVEPNKTYQYAVRAVSRRNLEGDPTAPVEATVEEVPGPVFTASLTENAHAVLLDGAPIAGKKHGKAQWQESSLDLRSGGHLTFPNDGQFALTQPLSVECWVRFDQRTQMPVVISCGHWRQAGWFLQWLGNSWRWHVGGIDCDGGRPEIGKWIHMVGTFDGYTARLYQDSNLLAEKSGSFITTPWPGQLHIGQYSGGPSPAFQVNGKIRGVRIHHRQLSAEEIAAEANETP